jgi:hypothetical protein
MQTECRISIRPEMGENFPCPSHSMSVQPTLRFPTDSRSLKSVPVAYVERHRPLTTMYFSIGGGRAFRKMPANFKVFQPRAARREL